MGTHQGHIEPPKAARGHATSYRASASKVGVGIMSQYQLWV